MPEKWEQVKAWRRRAEELRTVADNFAVPSAKEAMLNTAQSYERMANDLERRLKQQPETPEAGEN